MKDMTKSRAAYSAQEAAAACGSIYLLPIAAAKRARELKNGHPKRIITDAGPQVTALQEIEAGVFGFQKYHGSYKE